VKTPGLPCDFLFINCGFPLETGHIEGYIYPEQIIHYGKTRQLEQGTQRTPERGKSVYEDEAHA
jgi:hypothetical protein